MREGWVIAKLSDVCKIKPSKSEAKSKLAGTDLVSFLPMSDLGINQKSVNPSEERTLEKVSGSYTYFSDDDVLLAKITPCFENGKLGIARNLTNGVGFGSSEYIVFRSKGDIDPEYLFYFLSQDDFRESGAKVMTGAVGHKRVPKEYVENYKLPLPPLPEQKRIVAILDEAFAGIDKAIANTQQNLANARELFESYLNIIFTKKGDGWVTEELNKNVKFIDYRGKTPPKTEEGIRLITAKNVKMGYINREPEEFIDASVYDTWMTRGFPKKGDVLFTTEAPLGMISQLDTDETVVIGQRLITMQANPKIIDHTFLKYALTSKPLQNEIHSRSTGATVLGIKAKLLKQIPIYFPKEISEQKKIANKIELHENNCKRLEIISKQKLASLAELKQSLLQKAFSGELTATNVVTFPASTEKDTEIETTSPEFTANVLAFSHYWHASQRRDKTFGRVKAQKTLHLIESIYAIDLGRTPVKDAAGPNDFQHMLKAEDWAKANQFFEFTPKQTGNGYDFKKLGDYNKLIGGALAAVQSYRDKLEKILTIMLPMDTRQAEVLATVHAAWNNLLLDNANTTDEAIIYEARENWTESKRSIPEEEFRKSIVTIRSNGIIPDGTAKRVTGQENLL